MLKNTFNATTLAICIIASSLTSANVTTTQKITQDSPLQPVIIDAIEHQQLNPDVAKLALDAFNKAESEGKSSSPILTIVDYSLPSTEKRMWVFDLENQKLLFHNLVAHGKNSGSLYATSFSNQDGSHKTSLGLYLTTDTYVGHKGLSLHLQGLEKDINDHALERSIVVHGAAYANPDFITHYGRLGRSWGCPAVPEAMIKPLISTIQGGSLIFLYANDQNYLSHSHYI